MQLYLLYSCGLLVVQSFSHNCCDFSMKVTVVIFKLEHASLDMQENHSIKLLQKPIYDHDKDYTTSE